MFMNTWDIDDAARKYARHPVLGKATRFLAALRDEADSHSDGWAYWPLPARAAKRLMTMIQHPETATEDELRKSLAPIRSFFTRRGNTAGMTFPKDQL